MPREYTICSIPQAPIAFDQGNGRPKNRFLFYAKFWRIGPHFSTAGLRPTVKIAGHFNIVIPDDQHRPRISACGAFRVTRRAKYCAGRSHRTPVGKPGHDSGILDGTYEAAN
jgi:hypothetical protein